MIIGGLIRKGAFLSNALSRGRDVSKRTEGEILVN